MIFEKVRYIGYCGDGESEDISEGDVEKAYPTADYAVYSYKSGSYEGDGEIIVKQGGKFYHSSLGHCSCYGPTDNLDTSVTFNTIEDLLATSSAELREGFSPIVEKIKQLESRV